MEAWGYSPRAVAGFGVNGSFINCTGSHEGGINVCYFKVSIYVYNRLIGRTLPGHVLLVALVKRLTSQRIITLLKSVRNEAVRDGVEMVLT